MIGKDSINVVLVNNQHGNDRKDRGTNSRNAMLSFTRTNNKPDNFTIVFRFEILER